MMTSIRALALCVSGLVASAASAQLQAREVLVVYDSRNADSREVAEYYAGSAKVPGGVGGQPGVHPDVLVFNLQTGGQALALSGGCTYNEFITRIRNPIRAHLLAQGLEVQVRCLVMTKGLPHRIDDTDSPGIGDNPSVWATEFNNGDATAASMCGELSFLWQDLTAGEAGNGGDSRADGFIFNPLWRSTLPATTYSNAHSRVTNKGWIGFVGTGQGWTTSPAVLPPQRLAPGDIMLVSTLDGNSVADVKAMIDRAQNVVFNVNTAAFVFDESGSNGINDPGTNGELDNLAPTQTRFTDDYESSRDRIVNDKRFDPARVYYNAASNEAGFLVGPNVNYGGQGVVISDPLLALVHFGANHAGGKPGGTAGTTYASSFNYAPGAFFCTMESFNGRKFGGIGELGQEQAADFIEAGGTFAICNTWEPFGNFTADADLVIRSFYLGNMTWVEAAYTAMPCLSWMQMVVGDPLSRPIRSCEDIDGDGDVDLDDLYAWHANRTDLNRSGTIDAVDLELLQNTVRGWDHFNVRR